MFSRQPQVLTPQVPSLEGRWQIKSLFLLPPKAKKKCKTLCQLTRWTHTSVSPGERRRTLDLKVIGPGGLNTQFPTRGGDWLEPILREACSQAYPESAICVQRFDDSLNSAIRITYRISLRSSSLREPRYPLLRVVRNFVFHYIK